MARGIVVPEDMTPSAIERRLIRACKTIRALPDREARFLRNGGQAMWREVIDDYMHAYGSEDVKVRFIPNPRDVSDCLVALGWCNILSKNDFRLIWWRSFDNVSFAIIAARIGRSDDTARRRFYSVVDRIWEHALNEHYQPQAVAV